MKLNRISWTSFFLCSLISFAVWLKFSYPQLAITNFSVDRAKAVAIAKNYLQERGYPGIESYRIAAVYKIDEPTNRYLQKTVGFDGLKDFIKTYDYNMFYWSVRLFKENEKESFVLSVDSATGEITTFKHSIDDNEARVDRTREEAMEIAINFLTARFGFNPGLHIIRSNMATIRDNRSDHHFSWQRTSVSIPWSSEENTGTGKLLTSVTVAGDEILTFSKNHFMVPDQFSRDLDNRKDFSRNASIVTQTIILLLFIVGIYFMIVRQNHLAMHVSKNFYIAIMLISLFLSLIASFNQYENVLYYYQTTFSYSAYFWRTIMETILGGIFVTVSILIPSLAGELLYYEQPERSKEGSFLHYIQSTFASRNVAELIMLGYFVCVILLGMQSVLVQIGQTHFGVWVEHTWINNSSTAYFPFLAAFSFGYKTSFAEEIMYRLYAMALGHKILSRFRPRARTSNVLIAVFMTSLIWGFAHSSYPIFPMWFRGVEVTCLGFFIAFIYIKFGIIPVVVGHYLFDVFWNCAGYIFGVTQPFYLYSSLFILLIPMIFALIAFGLNRKEEEKPLRWQLNRHQLFNLDILKAFLISRLNSYTNKKNEEIRTDFIGHGWDPAVVDEALREVRDEPE